MKIRKRIVSLFVALALLLMAAPGLMTPTVYAASTPPEPPQWRGENEVNTSLYVNVKSLDGQYTIGYYVRNDFVRVDDLTYTVTVDVTNAKGNDGYTTRNLIDLFKNNHGSGYALTEGQSTNLVFTFRWNQTVQMWEADTSTLTCYVDDPAKKPANRTAEDAVKDLSNKTAVVRYTCLSDTHVDAEKENFTCRLTVDGIKSVGDVYVGTLDGKPFYCYDITIDGTKYLPVNHVLRASETADKTMTIYYFTDGRNYWGSNEYVSYNITCQGEPPAAPTKVQIAAPENTVSVKCKSNALEQSCPSVTIGVMESEITSMGEVKYSNNAGAFICEVQIDGNAVAKRGLGAFNANAASTHLIKSNSTLPQTITVKWDAQNSKWVLLDDPAEIPVTCTGVTSSDAADLLADLDYIKGFMVAKNVVVPVIDAETDKNTAIGWVEIPADAILSAEKTVETTVYNGDVAGVKVTLDPIVLLQAFNAGTYAKGKTYLPYSKDDAAPVWYYYLDNTGDNPTPLYVTSKTDMSLDNIRAKVLCGEFSQHGADIYLTSTQLGLTDAEKMDCLEMGAVTYDAQKGSFVCTLTVKDGKKSLLAEKLAGVYNATFPAQPTHTAKTFTKDTITVEWRASENSVLYGWMTAELFTLSMDCNKPEKPDLTQDGLVRIVCSKRQHAVSTNLSALAAEDYQDFGVSYDLDKQKWTYDVQLNGNGRSKLVNAFIGQHPEHLIETGVEENLELLMVWDANSGKWIVEKSIELHADCLAPDPVVPETPSNGTVYYPNYTEDADAEDADDAAHGEYTIICRKLNVRAGASTSSKKLGTLSRNTVVKGKDLGNGWLEIEYNGGKAYISAQYASGNTDAGSTATVACRKLNVRAGAGTDTAKIGSVSRGDTLTILETKNGWCRIVFNGGEGWVCAKYLA